MRRVMRKTIFRTTILSIEANEIVMRDANGVETHYKVGDVLEVTHRIELVPRDLRVSPWEIAKAAQLLRELGGFVEES